MMFTLLFFYAGSSPYKGNASSYAECYAWAQLHNKRGIQWAIVRNSDNVIIAQSKGYKA